MNDKHIERLRRLCHEWGGSLTMINEQKFIDLFQTPEDDSLFLEAPFQDWHGINWRDKHVFAREGLASANGLIHEMGHVFATKHHPDDKNTEFDWFGWEIALACQVGLYKEWSEGNASYGIDWWDPRGKYVRDWGHLNQTQRRELGADRIALGIKSKIIDKRGQPLAIR